MSNFRLLGHPLLIDFGEGSFSSCSCCDKGKTKTLDWSLTKVVFGINDVKDAPCFLVAK